MNEAQNNRFIRLATASAFASLFSYAVVFTITSATMNQISRHFGVDTGELGWIFRALMISFFAGVFVAGRYSDRYGKLRAIWPGCVAMAIGLIAFMAAPTLKLAILSTLLMGLGGGAAEASAMALVNDIYAGHRRTSMANWSQAAFAFGAIACPLAVGTLLKIGIAWRASYVGAAVICAASAVITLAAMASGREKLSKDHAGGVGLGKLLSDRLILILAIGILLYVGAETGTGNWLAVYFQHDLGSTPALAAWSISSFWLGISLGRVIAGWISRQLHEVTFMRWCLALGVVFQGLLILIQSPLSGIVTVFILGLCTGPVYPMITSCSGCAYPGQSGAVVGIVVAAGSLGGAIFPPTVGVVAGHTGMRLALLIPLVVFAVNLAVVLAIRKRDMERISSPVSHSHETGTA